MKKCSYLLLHITLSAFLLAQKSYAICPLCTIVVGTGVGLSRWLGVDDTISGLWIGGLIVSSIVWTIFWLDKKKIHFYGRKILVVLLYYLFIVAPLYYVDIIGHPFNRLWGFDKLLLGIVIGSIVFSIGGCAYIYLKNRKKEKVYFPFQKIVLPVTPLIVLTVVFYCITKCN